MRIIRVSAVLSCLALLVCTFVVLMEPNKFQKFNSLKSKQSFNGERLENADNKLPVESFLSEIPYIEKPYYIYSVTPYQRYQRTILGGTGDCSNFSFGGAYHFINNNIDFELVHFLPPDSLFAGGGHVAIRLPYEFKGRHGLGVIDIAGGGMPLIEGTIADIYHLVDQNESLVFTRINSNAPEYYRNYYTSEYLNQVFLGFTPSSDVIRYFSFVDTVFVGLGSEKLEKMLYDGLALLFGQYYNIYVYDAFIAPFKGQIIFFQIVLFLVRISLILILLLLISEIIYGVRKRFKTDSGSC